MVIAKNGAARPGRPRDPDIVGRAAAAALAVYGEIGWSGFSLEAVARRARVGKHSLYLRWASKEQLLVEALRIGLPQLTVVDSGYVRADLLALVRDLFRLYVGPQGTVALRLFAESAIHPELLGEFSHVDSASLNARTIVNRAIARRELPRRASTEVAIDCLLGAVVFHVRTMQTSPPALRARLAEGIDAYLGRLVDAALDAAHLPDPASGSRSDIEPRWLTAVAPPGRPEPG
jgi:AcrR family transcriptional regulator